MPRSKGMGCRHTCIRNAAVLSRANGIWEGNFFPYRAPLQNAPAYNNNEREMDINIAFSSLGLSAVNRLLFDGALTIVPNGVLAYICRLEEDTPVPTEQFVRLLIANGKGRTLHKAFYSQEGYSGIRGPPNTTKPSFPATDERDAAEQDVCAALASFSSSTRCILARSGTNTLVPYSRAPRAADLEQNTGPTLCQCNFSQYNGQNRTIITKEETNNCASRAQPWQTQHIPISISAVQEYPFNSCSNGKNCTEHTLLMTPTDKSLFAIPEERATDCPCQGTDKGPNSGGWWQLVNSRGWKGNEPDPQASELNRCQTDMDGAVAAAACDRSTQRRKKAFPTQEHPKVSAGECGSSLQMRRGLDLAVPQSNLKGFARGDLFKYFVQCRIIFTGSSEMSPVIQYQSELQHSPKNKADQRSYVHTGGSSAIRPSSGSCRAVPACSMEYWKVIKRDESQCCQQQRRLSCSFHPLPRHLLLHSFGCLSGLC
ncbi:hypothetical protein Anapl_09320 [Anas platyrhynchos]|uniref:Uncharacterized protein n=1 Tax=Anas platyrhynchos TaxID=8839 RepID=R0K9U8_ANAPL|nr:hypothetical protein Anapl_09320 [Anas platyrhynchos]